MEDEVRGGPMPVFLSLERTRGRKGKGDMAVQEEETKDTNRLSPLPFLLDSLESCRDLSCGNIIGLKTSFLSFSFVKEEKRERKKGLGNPS